MTTPITKNIQKSKKNLLNILFYILVFLLASVASTLEFFGMFCNMRGPHSFDACDVYTYIGIPIILINWSLFVTSFWLTKFRWIIPLAICILFMLSNYLVE